MAIGAGIVHDAADDAFSVNKVVRKRRDVAHVDATEDDCATGGQGGECGGHQFSGGREDNSGVKGLRRTFGGSAYPDRS